MKERPLMTRRELLRGGVRCAGIVALGSGLGFLGGRGSAGNTVWQINPEKCIQCGNCSDYCVLNPSAVKCVHEYRLCGYCEPCFAFFQPDQPEQTTGAEGQLCPVGAITRKHVKGPLYEYTIDEEKCIACGRCVKNCSLRGNGSLYLQVRHDRCLNCSQCSIAEACPSGAFERVPAGDPHFHRIKGKNT